MEGGAIYSFGAILQINDTLAGDSADTSGALGGEFRVASATIANSILADSGLANNCVASTITDGGHNLDSGTTCGFSAANHSLNNTDPLLGALADNGGPTQTLALLLKSPAIDAGDDATCSAAPVGGIDQRGVARPQGAHCDIGAYEYAQIATTTALAATPSTQAQGLAVQLCATVTGAGTATHPTGSVTFFDGATSLGSTSLSSGKACVSTSTLSLGSHGNRTAHYGGDASFLASTSKPATVFIGFEGNGGAGTGTGTGTGPVQTGPNGSTNTGGPVTTNPVTTGTGPVTIGPAPVTNTTTHPTATATSSGLPLWPLLAGIVGLALLLGGAGGMLARRRTRVQRATE